MGHLLQAYLYLSIQALAYVTSQTIPSVPPTILPTPPLAELTSTALQYCYISPNVCPNDNITFYVYTGPNTTQPIFLGNGGNREQIRNTNFRTPIKFLIHGSNRGHNDTPNKELRPAYFQKLPNYTIISPDYYPLCRLPCYPAATVNSAVVARCLTLFIQTILQEKPNIKQSDFHIVGHSLGAQVAGQMATYLTTGQRYRRITGLDPARNFFYQVGPIKTHDQLDDGDADLVDVVHSNAGMLGKIRPVGKIDFYANGGSFQPGCNIYDPVCSHDRSAAYFAETINSQKNTTAQKCQDPPPYTLGQCVPAVGPAVTFGENVDPNAAGIYYLSTGATPPYLQR